MAGEANDKPVTSSKEPRQVRSASGVQRRLRTEINHRKDQLLPGYKAKCLLHFYSAALKAYNNERSGSMKSGRGTTNAQYKGSRVNTLPYSLGLRCLFWD